MEIVVALLTMYLIWMLKSNLTKAKVTLNDRDGITVFLAALIFSLISQGGMFGLFAAILLGIYTKEIWDIIAMTKAYIQRVIRECYILFLLK